jgi:hypothetical protein
MELINVYKKNRGISKLFSEVNIVDWYDGATTGVSKLNNSSEWYIFNLCYFDPDKDIRIFTLILATNKWVDEFRAKESNHDDYGNLKRHIGVAFENYHDRVFLLNAANPDSLTYEIAELPKSELKYCETVEEAINQERNQWLSYFNREID